MQVPTLEQALKVYNATPHREMECGVSARFVAVTDTIGLKIYRDRETAEGHCNTLHEHYDAGVAPWVGDDVFKLGTSGDWGFFVEIVTVAAAYFDEATFGKSDLGMCKMSYEERDLFWWLTHQLEVSPEFKALQKAAKANGLYLDDTHAYNLGYTKEGRLVMLDCGWD